MPFEKNVRKFGSNSDIFRPFGSEYFAFGNGNLDRLTPGIFSLRTNDTPKKEKTLDVTCSDKQETDTFDKNTQKFSAAHSSGEVEKGNFSSSWTS